MTYRYLPADLPDRLRRAGLVVVEIDGWERRGRPASTGEFKPVGVLNHHTGSRDVLGDFADDLAYAKWMFLEGRSDLPAPLCGLSISLEGVVYVGAAGRANHAGRAAASGSVSAGDGNALYEGIEWMLSGTQTIPAKMYEAGVKTNAVLLDIFGSSEQAVSCHYQTSVTGKWDIGDPNGIDFKGKKVLDVNRFRAAIKEYRTPKPVPSKRGVRVLLAMMRHPDSVRDGHLPFALSNAMDADAVVFTEAYKPPVRRWLALRPAWRRTVKAFIDKVRGGFNNPIMVRRRYRRLARHHQIISLPVKPQTPENWKYGPERVMHSVTSRFDIGDIMVVGLHLNYPANARLREAYDQSLLEVRRYLKPNVLTGEKIIVAGDLNWPARHDGPGSPGAAFKALGMEYWADDLGYIAWTPNLVITHRGTVPAQKVGSDHAWMYADFQVRAES